MGTDREPRMGASAGPATNTKRWFWWCDERSLIRTCGRAAVSTQCPRRGLAATRLRGISRSWWRRRDSSPGNIRVVAAAAPRLVSTECPRRTPRRRRDPPAEYPRGKSRLQRGGLARRELQTGLGLLREFEQRHLAVQVLGLVEEADLDLARRRERVHERLRRGLVEEPERERHVAGRRVLDGEVHPVRVAAHVLRGRSQSSWRLIRAFGRPRTIHVAPRGGAATRSARSTSRAVDSLRKPRSNPDGPGPTGRARRGGAACPGARPR